VSYSVIVPSKNIYNLRPCVEAIRKQQPDADVLIVNDGIDARACERIEGCLWTPGETPFIFARNINIGIRAVPKEDDVILLNDDTLLETEHGFDLLAETAQDPNVGLVSPVFDFVGNPNQRPKATGGVREEPDWVLCFVCVYVPRRVLNMAGLLDERFTGYGAEDNDYSIRVKKAGLKLMIDDRVFVNHTALKSTFRTQPGWRREMDRAMGLLREKWGMDQEQVVPERYLRGMPK